jgi:hypothetical protein
LAAEITVAADDDGMGLQGRLVPRRHRYRLLYQPSPCLLYRYLGPE